MRISLIISAMLAINFAISDAWAGTRDVDKKESRILLPMSKGDAQLYERYVNLRCQGFLFVVRDTAALLRKSHDRSSLEVFDFANEEIRFVIEDGIPTEEVDLETYARILGDWAAQYYEYFELLGSVQEIAASPVFIEDREVCIAYARQLEPNNDRVPKSILPVD